ncbi:hypothetical protein Tco_1041032 [Tanacetum coccineum]|uniref:Uncharacterized protein n=1 Tax=Tanacetum coccineum TaxID=301880 RepID=A0ABQ5GH93_9ASTR
MVNKSTMMLTGSIGHMKLNKLLNLVNMHDIHFHIIGVTTLVLEDVLEGEDVDVVNPDGFDGDTSYDNETRTYRRRSSKEVKDIVYLHSIESRRELKLYKNDKTRIFDQVRVNPQTPVKAVLDQLQHDLELQSTNPNTTIKIVVERNIDLSLPTRVLKRIYGSFPGQVLAAIRLRSNNEIYLLAYALVEAKSKSSWCSLFEYGSEWTGRTTPEALVNPCYWLTTWRETYSHKVEPINGTNYWEKSTCPTSLLPPNHHVQIDIPKNIGHNKAICKGQGNKNAEASGSAFGQTQQAKHDVVGQDGSGGLGVGLVPNAYCSGVGSVIGLSAASGQPHHAGVGVGYQAHPLIDDKEKSTNTKT